MFLILHQTCLSIAICLLLNQNQRLRDDRRSVNSAAVMLFNRRHRQHNKPARESSHCKRQHAHCTGYYHLLFHLKCRRPFHRLFGRDDPNFSQLTVHRWAKFGWIPFADLCLRSLAMKWNAEFTDAGWKLTSSLKPFVDQSSRRFNTM